MDGRPPQWAADVDQFGHVVGAVPRGLDEEKGEFEILTGYPSDLIVQGKDFVVKAHAVVTWKSLSLKMIIQQPANQSAVQMWILDKSTTRQAVLCFLRYFYTGEVDFDELDPDDYDHYCLLLETHMPDDTLQKKVTGILPIYPGTL